MIQNESEITNLQVAKHVIISALLDEKFITSEQASEFNKRYAIIMVKPKWFKHVFSKLFPSYDMEGSYYKVIKFIGSEMGTIETTDDINELLSMLSKASAEEDFELAKKIQEKITKLKNK